MALDNKLDIPMEEMAQVAFNKDIQIAMLMKENKELRQILEATTKANTKPAAVQAESQV